MGSISSFSRKIDSKSSSNHIPPSFSPETVMKEGRSYSPLTKIQRLNRLIKILSSLVSNSFGRCFTTENADRISKWWDEFKSGRILIIKKPESDATPDSTNDKDDFIGSLVSDVRTVNQPNHVSCEDELIDSSEAFDDIDFSEDNEPLATHYPHSLASQVPNHLRATEEDNQSVDEDGNEQATSQFDSQDHEEIELESEEDSEVLNGSKPIERQTFKPNEPQLNIKPKQQIEEVREYSLDVERNPTQEDEVPDGITDDSDSLSHDSETEDQDEASSLGQNEALEISEPPLLNEEELAEAHRKEKESAIAERIQTISQGMKEDIVIKWLSIAEKNIFLKNTRLFENIKGIVLKLDKYIDEEEFKELLINQYTDYEDKILAIRNCSDIELEKLIQKQEEEFVFQLLKNQEAQLSECAKKLTSHKNGKFKENLQALLELISTPSSQPSSHSSEEEEESLDKSIQLNEMALSSLDTAKAFGNFANKINEEINRPAKEAFTIFTEIFKTGGSAKNLFAKLKEYNDAEAAVQNAVKELGTLLKDIENPSLIKQLPNTLDTLNNILKPLARYSLNNKPSLKNLLLQNTPNAGTAYLLLEAKSKAILAGDLSQKLAVAMHNLRTHLGAKEQERLNFVINIGREVLKNPERVLNQYLETEGVLRFTSNPPESSSNVEEFLKTIDANLDQRTYTADELLALEAFTSVALYTYIINPQSTIDPSYKPIAEILTAIRAKIEIKLQDREVQADVVDVRKTKQSQNFYQFLKKRIENTPSYPSDFWYDPTVTEKMRMSHLLLRTIGNKIADPNNPPNDPALLIHKNDSIGYEIYFYPAESENEKPKLLLFLTKESKSAAFQGMNHQLGLFGDPNILSTAQEVISNITSTNVLEGYQQDLKEGNLQIIASGFDNSGAAASIVANKLALIYPKTSTMSISAASTTTVTTEDAYNIKQAENFYAIRLKYGRDGEVDRTLSQYTGDFSENSYHTFPLLVKYNHKAIDINKHNKEEYGNVDNFIPAMTNPLILKSLYQEISGHIVYHLDEIDTPPQSSMSGSSVSSTSIFDDDIVIPVRRIGVGQIDDLIELGDHIRQAIGLYQDAFLKLDGEKLSSADKSQELKEINQTKEEEEKVQPLTFIEWIFGKVPAIAPVVQKSLLTVEEQENTIKALRQTILYLKDPKIMDLITPEKAISLLLAAETLLINYTKINTNIGRLPQLVDLISEIGELANKRLEVLYQDATTREAIQDLLTVEGANFELLASRVFALNPYYQNLFHEKRDVLSKIDYEDRFLEYLGFKIAVTGQEDKIGADKLGSDRYVAKLYSSKKDNFDISLYTPEDPQKKQRIVICCKGDDRLGTHKVLTGKFGAGDSHIIPRGEKLKKLISAQLEAQFKQHGFNAKDVDIVVTGFGAEGAVATVVGYYLAEEYQKENCQVQSVGFGSPRFTTKEGADSIRAQNNFLPLRFLSPDDRIFEWQLVEKLNYVLSHDTYYTIPFHFRIVGALETSHNTNLYGDIQGIKTSMKTACRLRRIAFEKRKSSTLEETSDSSTTESMNESSEIPVRIILDSRKAFLIDFSQRTVAALQQVEPGKLIGVMKYCVELSEKETITDEEKQHIHQFFSTFIQSIRNDDINENHLKIENVFYKKMVAHGYKPNQLFAGNWSLQQIISKDLDDAMKNVNSIDENSDLSAKTKNELILKRDYYRGILAGDLNGNRYKPAGGGVNGAVFFRHLESGLKKDHALLPDEKGHRPFLGVFKPHPETVREFKGWLDATQWGERAKYFFGMDGHLNQADPNCRVNNEIFAYELFHIFGFNSFIGFPTTLKFNNKNDSLARPASFCSFIPGLDIVAAHVREVSKADAKSDTLNLKRKYSEQELHIWQMSKIFDYLTGNLDGHEGNAFVKVNDKLQIIGAVNFDYDKAFAIDSPTNIGNQYKWANLLISKQDFTKATKQALIQMFMSPDAEEKINSFLLIARDNDLEDTVKFATQQEQLLRYRIENLKKVVSGDIRQLSDLINYK